MNEIIYTVSELNFLARELLENNFFAIYVEGEVSNLIKASSGHWYFSLKDQEAQIRCAMFKQVGRFMSFDIQEGSHVKVRAKVSLYTARGDYQLIVENIEESGEGLLRQTFEHLKKKLFNLGLFSEIHKKKIPQYPQKIGLITSPTGAALYDLLKVLKRRAPYIPIIIYPTIVQGKSAPKSISNMIKLANKRNECDVLILGRGGGSLEDLWTFNDEELVYAIFKSKIPIISAIGHEIDTTLSDLVSDLSASTPSVAAELVSSKQEELMNKFFYYHDFISKKILNFLNNKNQILVWTSKRLRHPLDYINENKKRIASIKKQIEQLSLRCFKEKEQIFFHLLKNLNTLSPLNHLERGYALIKANDRFINSIKTIKEKDSLSILMKDGELKVKVNQIKVY